MNSRMTNFEEEKRLCDFAKKVAEDFTKHPEHTTYGEMNPGDYLGIRWGMDNDCVLVVRLDEFFHPVNFQQAIKKGGI